MAIRIKKCVAAFVLCSCIIQCTSTLPAFAASYEDNTEKETTTGAVRTKEIEELREVNSETYLLSDGTLSAEYLRRINTIKTTSENMLQLIILL